MPTFNKLYQEVGDLFLFVQIKNPQHTARIIDKIREIVPTEKMDHISFMGFQDSIIQNKTYPDLLWGKHYFIPTTRNMRIIRQNMKRPEIGIVSPFYLLLTERRLKLIKKLKTSIVPYTPNSVKALKKIEQMNVEAFYTDKLEKALAVIE
jgi:glycerophosphoryl diester phosphodiesterase